jgi:N-methylhydantoinase B
LISGGGGLGDPLERDPNLVLMDLLNGYILEEQVKSVYGVVISDGIVNREATELIRKEIRVEENILITVRNAVM